jgi:hypothetical protein
MRAGLARPWLQLVNGHEYNQLFTIHGTIMMLLFATPMFAGFANAVMPLQIGAPDVAFPRLNALSYWMYLFGGLMVVSGFLVPGGATAFGWSPTHRSTVPCARPDPESDLCGPWGWWSRACPPRSARSTSSPPYCVCGRPA